MGKDRTGTGSNQPNAFGKKGKNNKQPEFTIPALSPEQVRNADTILERSTWLGHEFQNFRYKRNDWRWVKNEHYDFFEEWLPYYVTACEVDLLAGKLGEIQVPQKELARAPSEEVFYKSYSFFKDYTWSARFASNYQY
jgi:hypothetical protein